MKQLDILLKRKGLYNMNKSMHTHELVKKYMNKAMHIYEPIKEFNNDGLLGFVISESVNEMDNSYEDMGRNLINLIERNPDQIDLIERVVIALTGYSFETIKDRMEYNKEYYEKYL